MANHSSIDCLIIGGGPAGLTAATYLGRFLRSVVVVDAGRSRAALIPESHNYPGFASGISGPGLLASLREQALQYGARIEQAEVRALARDGDGFVAHSDDATISAARVILASGIVDESPSLPGLRDAIYRGALRYCPICDGYEATDRRIGVLGTIKSALSKAQFLRGYSRDVVLLATDDPAAIGEDEARVLDECGIAMPRQPVADVERAGDDDIAAVLRDGTRVTVDVLYPALGCDVRSSLATDLGAEANDVGCLIVDAHQQTSVPGLYAAGDVVSDLHQISVATGHAAIAATAVHNSLPRRHR